MPFSPKVPKKLRCLGEVNPVNNTIEGVVAKDVGNTDGGPTIIAVSEK